MNAKGYFEELEEEQAPAPERITIAPEVLARIARSARPAPVTPPAAELILDAVALPVEEKPAPIAPEPAVVGKVYEMGKDGGLVEVKSNFNNLPAGTVITWGGNAAWAETSYCILNRYESKYGVSYDCYNLDNPEANSHLHRVEARSIKAYDDDSVWHSQHFFLEEETKSSAEVEALKADYNFRRLAHEDAQAAAKREGDRLEAEGRKLWPILLGNCPAVIIAEQEHDESDVQTDYFGSRTISTVILAASKHGRDLFPEMRKAAEKIEETRHLGVGKGKFTPYVAIAADFRDNGSCYYKGSRSHWHRELDKDDNYNSLVFLTREDAQAYIDEKGTPEPINFGGTLVTFEWKISEDEIEHREKYSMGKGYYLGYHYESGWHVCKRVLPNSGPTRGDYITLAQRHDHLKAGK